ncbi:MAG TPA: ABC transporter substrate-binding protein [Actinomycetota bacterium]|nr:ABC transporter substrate-binding protein [Actinomycetota bacterium]
MTLVYDTVMWRDADGEPRPWLARKITTSPDGRTVTIKLRRGARWHDGVPLTADDLVFTFDFVATHYHPRFSPQMDGIDEVRARGRDTVVVVLERPSPGFYDQPLADVPIVPRHLWEGLAQDEARPACRWAAGLTGLCHREGARVTSSGRIARTSAARPRCGR